MAVNLDVGELDRVVLNLTNQLCSQLGIVQYHPSKVVWSTLDPRFSNVPLDIDEPIIMRHKVVIHEALRKSLNPDQLRAMLADVLVREKDTGAHGKQILLAIPLSLITVAILGFILLPIAFPERTAYFYYRSSAIAGYGPTGYIIAWSLIPLLVIVGIGLFRLYIRRRTIDADKRVAQIFGKEPLLSALRAIEASAPPMPKQRIGPDWQYNRRLKIVRRRISALENESNSLTRPAGN